MCRGIWLAVSSYESHREDKARDVPMAISREGFTVLSKLGFGKPGKPDKFFA